MRSFTTVAAVALLLAFGALAGHAEAQYKGKSRPFDTTTRRPSVSPYMNLVNNNNTNNGATNYQSFVRPQMEQQAYNARSAAAIKGLQKQAAVASSQRSKSSSEGNQKLRATGHAATHENYSHFYPALREQR